ncbi:VOC family protein [Gilvibacter sp.]|uniref:VOC family protein n=1 Tax=Gilvibacter sp. TaxID=2729997 RepID=UPI003B51BF32
MNKVVVNWFEIPTTDIKRAKVFYEQILDCQMQLVDIGGFDMCFFPGDPSAGATGALIAHETYTPSHAGTLVYLMTDDVAVPLAKVAGAGGKVLREKTQISPEHGFMGVFEDTEGNRVALHSNT